MKQTCHSINGVSHEIIILLKNFPNYYNECGFLFSFCSLSFLINSSGRFYVNIRIR